MKKLLYISFVVGCFLYAPFAGAQPIWTPGCYIHENDLPYEPNYHYQPIRENTADGQYYGIANTFRDVSNNNISINASVGCGFINQGVGNLGTQGLDYDIWTNGDVDDMCIFGLYDQHAGSGHPFPYVYIQYGGTYDIIPPTGINYISGSVHAYAAGINHGPPTLPGLSGVLHNTGDGKGAAAYSYLQSPSGVKKFRLKGYRTNDWINVPYPWSLYDVPLGIPSTAQILDVVGVESYIYVLYFTNAYTLKALVYDYDGNLISASPFTHNLGVGNTFNMASIQFYIDVSTLNIIGDCFKTGKNKIFADQLTPTGFTFKTILPLTGNSQGVVYNLKSELQDNNIYIDAKNVVTNNRVLYKINKTNYSVLYTQTMTYTGDYYIDKSATGGITDFYVFYFDVTGTVLKVDRYDETPAGFTTLTATSSVNCFLPPFGFSDFCPLEVPPFKVADVIDQGFAPLVIMDEITHTANSIGPFELIIDLTGFPSRLQNEEVVDANSNASISIYPNPSSAEITIELKDASKVKSIEVFNMTGGLVATYKGMKDKIILQKDLPEGIYFLHLTTEDGEVITKKFVKTNQ